jgi:hypothetical protein
MKTGKHREDISLQVVHLRQNSQPLSLLHGFVDSQNNNARFNSQTLLPLLLFAFNEERPGNGFLSPIKKVNNISNTYCLEVLITLLSSFNNKK